MGLKEHEQTVEYLIDLIAEVQTVHRRLRLSTRTLQPQLEGPPILPEVVR